MLRTFLRVVEAWELGVADQTRRFWGLRTVDRTTHCSQKSVGRPGW